MSSHDEDKELSEALRRSRELYERQQKEQKDLEIALKQSEAQEKEERKKTQDRKQDKEFDQKQAKEFVPIQKPGTPILKELFKAVRGNDFDRVKKIIESNPKLDLNCIPTDLEPDKCSLPLIELNTLLLTALSMESMEIAQHLLAKGANPWLQNMFGFSALHMLAMVGRKMETVEEERRKEEQILSFLQKLIESLDASHFKQEIGKTGPFLFNEPNQNVRNPIALSIGYQKPSVMTQFVSILMSMGGTYKAVEPIWSAVLNATYSAEKMPLVAKLFPALFALDSLKRNSVMFNGNGLVVAVKQGSPELLALCFEAEKSAKLTDAWKDELNDTKPGILHLLLDNLSYDDQDIRRSEMMIELLLQGLPNNIKNPGTGQTVMERVKGLANKEFLKRPGNELQLKIAKEFVGRVLPILEAVVTQNMQKGGPKFRS